MLDEPLEVVWTARAAAGLDEAHRYIAADNPTAADELIDEINARVAQLAVLPNLGVRRRIRKIRGGVRELVIGRYRVFYRPETETSQILVLLIWHSSRRHPKASDF